MVSLDSPETPYSDGYDCLTKISIRMEDFEAPERYQDKTEEVASDDQLGILSNRVLLLNHAGECEQSRAVAQKWLDARPYSLSAQIMLGMGYMCSDNYEEAILIQGKGCGTVAHLPLMMSTCWPFPMPPMEWNLKPSRYSKTSNISHLKIPCITRPCIISTCYGATWKKPSSMPSSG